MVTTADARIGDGHVEYGLAPAAGASVRLPRAIPGAFARYLLLTGENISGTEAAQKGLAARAVEPQALDEEIDRIGPAAAPAAGAPSRQSRRCSPPALRRGRAPPATLLDLFLDHVGQGEDARACLEAFHNGAPG